MDNEILKCGLDAINRGDIDAFDEIYMELRVPVYTIIFRILYDEPLAEDVMQEVFIKLLQSPPSPHIKNPRAWIFKIARNLAIDNKRKSSPYLSSDDMKSLEPSLEDTIGMRLDVETAMRLLPLDEREIVSLHINAGFKFREIADITDIPLGTVLWKYQKAIGRLRSYFNGGAI